MSTDNWYYCLQILLQIWNINKTQNCIQKPDIKIKRKKQDKGNKRIVYNLSNAKDEEEDDDERRNSRFIRVQ